LFLIQDGTSADTEETLAVTSSSAAIVEIAVSMIFII
jgi:hypothetical protein